MSELSQPNIKKNILYNALLQLAILLIPFITTPYVSRVLGAANIGKYSFATSVVGYFLLFATLGTNTYGPKKIAACRNDPFEVSQVFWNTFSFRAIFGLLFASIYLLFIYFFEGFNIINLLVAVNFFDSAVNITWFFQGIEDFKKIAIRNLLVRVLMLAAIFILVNSSDDLWLYVSIIIFSSVCGNLLMWLSLPSIIKRADTIRPFSNIKEIWLIFLPSIAIQVYTVLDKSMIGWITGSDYLNGCYEQSERIARLAITVVTSVGAVFLPRVSNLYHHNNSQDIEKYIYKAFRIVWFLSIPMMLGLNGVASIFIPVFLGKGFEASILLLEIFSFLILIVSVAYILGLSYLVPTNQQNVYTVAVSIAAIINFISNIILIPKYGAIGAAFSSVFAELIGALIQLFYCLCSKQLKFKNIFASSLKYWCASIIMYVIIVILKRFIPTTIISLVSSIMIGIAVYFLLLILFKDELMIQLLKSIRIKINKKIV